MIVAALALAAVLLLLRLPNFPRSIVLLHPLFAGAALLGCGWPRAFWPKDG
jgi:hypothetical protein